jgi:hypothetical protein
VQIPDRSSVIPRAPQTSADNPPQEGEPSPLVVEGYADATEDEAAYLLSEDRAQTVRVYLLGRFRRQATLTDIMPSSDSAPGSPRGDGRWSGVALTLFVSNDALGRANREATP